MKRFKPAWFYLCITAGIIIIAVSIVECKMSTTQSFSNSLYNTTPCIIIDAGHGGEDGGAVSCTGIYESKINLQIALRMEDLFHLLGYRTKMIRRSDISVYTHGDTLAAKKVSDLKNRVKIVNETENAVLLSIHQNYFTQSQYSGPQVFFADTKNSKALAENVQTQMNTFLAPENTRRTKKASGVYLMEHIECTGILIECGFLSNPKEEALLKSEVYQKELSTVIVTSVCNFLDQYENC